MTLAELTASRARCRLAWLKWSVSDLARKVEIPNRTLHTWLDGKGRGPSVELLSRLAAALGVSVRYLVDPAEDAWQELWNALPPG